MSPYSHTQSKHYLPLFTHLRNYTMNIIQHIQMLIIQNETNIIPHTWFTNSLNHKMYYQNSVQYAKLWNYTQTSKGGHINGHNPLRTVVVGIVKSTRVTSRNPLTWGPKLPDLVLAVFLSQRPSLEFAVWHFCPTQELEGQCQGLQFINGW